jgi:hypothetical protein
MTFNKQPKWFDASVDCHQKLVHFEIGQLYDDDLAWIAAELQRYREQHPTITDDEVLVFQARGMRQARIANIWERLRRWRADHAWDALARQNYECVARVVPECSVDEVIEALESRGLIERGAANRYGRRGRRGRR